jgi:hypothetical protein
MAKIDHRNELPLERELGSLTGFDHMPRGECARC